MAKINDYCLEEAYQPKPQVLEPWQLWICSVPNEHAYDLEEPKKRPIIIVDPYYDVEDLEDSTQHYPEDDFYPDIIKGTSKYEKYKDRPGVVALDKQEANALGLNHATAFLVFKLIEYIRRGQEGILSAKQIYDEGGYLGKLDDSLINKIKYILKNDKKYSSSGIAIEELDSNNSELKSEKVYDFIEDIYDLRKESIASEGEFGLGNLVFKEFRNLGYLDALKQVAKILKGNELSLEHVNKDQLEEEVSLQKATPYMLRNDGKLLECGEIHPYIYYNVFEEDERELAKLIQTEDSREYIKWFYTNTLKDVVKDEISLLLYSITNCNELEYLHKDAQKIINKLGIKPVGNTLKDKEQIIDVFNALNDDTNQEFCRVRVSNLKFLGDSNEVYFRISSINFNWFDLIWTLVMNNKNFIKDITIVKDTQTFGGRYDPYSINGKKVEHMPTEEFLTLEGNPIVEKFKFSKDALNDSFEQLGKGKLISEAYWYMHPRYAHGWYSRQIKESLDWDMQHILNPHEVLDEDFSQKTLDAIYNYTLDHNGGTFNLRTGESLTGTKVVENVYSVEFLSKEWNQRIAQVDKQEVLNAIENLINSEQVKHADAIGTWSSGKDERPQSSVGLDKFFKDREEAEKFALEHEQDAIGVFDSKGNYYDTIYKRDFKYKPKEEEEPKEEPLEQEEDK